MVTANHIGVIILAAGESSRLGSPKQLLHYAGKTLLQHTVQVAIDSIAHPVIVVLGAHEELIKNALESTGLYIVRNTKWKEGMASSVRCGIEELLKINPLASGAVIMLCDQPYVTATLVNNLAAAHEQTGKAIVTSSYSGTVGPPTFFHKTIFPELMLLKGDVGAKPIIRQHANDVVAVEFLNGDVDIDTIGDYEHLANNESKFP